MKKNIFKGVALIGFVGLQAHASVTTYDVSQTYNQVVYHHSNPTWDTLFNGSFSYGSVTNTTGHFNSALAQAMTGNTQSRLFTKTPVLVMPSNSWIDQEKMQGELR